MKYILLFIFFIHFTLLDAAIPSGYYDLAEGKKAEQLKNALHQIIANDTTGYLRYGSGVGRTWQGFYSTDRNMVTNAVIDMYSPEIRYFPDPNPDFSSFGQEVHIEHSLPKSWWGGSESVAAYTDLHHLYPADGPTNTSKSNHPLGVVTGTVNLDNGVSKVGIGTYPGYNNRVFEPADEYKGDFARTYMYMATAYQNYSNSWNSPMMDNNTYPVFNSWALNLLLQWHRQDPVSEKETTRTDVVFSFQNNRNPFIDYPELAEHIWGSKTDQPFYTSPTSTGPNISAIVAPLNSNVTIEIETQSNSSVQRSFYVKCDHLRDGVNISISGSNANLFSASRSSISQFEATNGEEIFIVYSPISKGNHSATLTISSEGASPFVINLSGQSK